MLEKNGDWTITDDGCPKTAPYVVTGHMMQWHCKTLDKARKVAELLTRVYLAIVDVGPERN